MFKFHVAARIALVMTVACLIFACNGQNNGNNQPNVSPTSAVTASTANLEAEMPRISVADVRKMVAEGKAIIIDVRGSEAYKISHIKGAVDIPLNRLEAGDFQGLPNDKRIIAYCA